MSDRDTMGNWAENKIKKGEIDSYQAVWNSISLDGLPSLKAGRKKNGEKYLWIGDTRAWLKRTRWDTFLLGTALGATIGLVGTRVVMGRSS